jgi:acetyltransferase
LNLGNSIQLGVEDMLELLDESHGADSSKIVLLYLEAVNKPQKLLHHAKSLTAKGCVLIGIKSGVTEVGARAAASHTGAMTTSDHAVQALFDKAGIIRVKSKQELIETTCALIALGGLPKGNRACIVTDAGGPGVMLADELYRQGIELPSLSPRATERLKQVLPPQASLGNPIDCLPSRNAQQVGEIFTILAEEETQTIDLAFFLTGNSGMSDNWEIYQEIIRIGKTGAIPVLPVLSSATTCADLLEKVKAAETVYFPDEVIAGQAVGRIVNRPRIMDQIPALTNYDYAAISQALSAQQAALPPESVTRILKAAGFKLVPQIEVSEIRDLADACQTVGFPLVMKVVGPLHKSDTGGVKIGINTVSEAQRSWQELTTIPKATAVLIQKRVTGVEVILGASREPPFGHVILFGLGGIYTEVIKDIQFALTPLSPGEALRMIQRIRSFPILKGIRGERGASVELLTDYLVRLGRLVHDFPEIREIDLNPVKGSGKDLYPVDCRILVDRATD